jgi:hypothetical protein
MSLTRLESEGSAIVSKLALARISEDLMTDPVAREQFIEDPVGWVQRTYRVTPSPSDREFLQGYQQLMADGNCCGGCSCPPPTEKLRTQMTRSVGRTAVSRASRA